METSVSQALFWMWLRPQSRGHQLESSCAEEPLAAAPGDREPRPGREQGNRGSSPSSVCAKGLGKSWSQQMGLEATAPPPQTPGPKAPPFPLPLETGLCGISQLLPQPVRQSCREHGNHLPTTPPLTLLQLVYFSNLNFIFLER